MKLSNWRRVVLQKSMSNPSLRTFATCLTVPRATRENGILHCLTEARIMVTLFVSGFPLKSTENLMLCLVRSIYALLLGKIILLNMRMMPDDNFRIPIQRQIL